MIKFFIFRNYANVLLFLISFFTISMRQFRILSDCSGKIGFYLNQIKQMNNPGFPFPLSGKITVRQLYLYSIEAADFPDPVTSENTLREFPLVIATVAKVSRKQRTLARCPRKKRKTDCICFICTLSFCILSILLSVSA